MAAGRLVLSEYMPARDRNDDLVAGAKMYVYLNGTTTPASIFTSSSLATPLANPVVANSSGQFAAIWVDRGTLETPTFFTMSVTGPNGESIGNPSVFDDVTASYEEAAAGSAIAAAASAAAAQAAETNAETAETAAELAATQATGGQFKTVSATTYTLLAGDNRYNIRFTAATAITVTVPAGLTHHYIVFMRQCGLGQITVEPAVSVTIDNADGGFTSEQEGVVLTLESSASNTYDLDGRTV